MKPMLKPSQMMAIALLAGLPATAALAQASPEAAPAAAPAPAPVAAPVAAAPPATKTAEAAAEDRANEMVCRKTQETGSLVKVKKTCHTRSQWAYIEQENKRMGQDFILNNQGRPTGN
jgi:hypothetical protein